MTTASAREINGPAMGISRILQVPAQWILRLFGWTIVGSPPDAPKHVLIGAHHTSNLDGFLLVIVTTALQYKVNFLMKDSMFKGFMGPVARWLGGIAIDRSQRHNTVQQIADAFNKRDQLAIAIAPEGTRKHTTYWRSGFYHIAMTANVPLQLAGVDYPTRTVFFGPLLTPSGDIDADMEIIREFFKDKTPRYPEKAGPIVLKPPSE